MVGSLSWREYSFADQASPHVTDDNEDFANGFVLCPVH
jgi:hypothetical protein